MTALLANIFLGCFLVGFILTAASFLFGFDSHGGDLSAPGHGGDIGDFSVDAPDAPGHHGAIGILNFNSIALFLTWFGATGYILNGQSRVGPLLTILSAVIAGFAGAIIICLFVNKFLIKGDTTMRPMDYYLPGTLARVTSAIRQGGAGEIVYVQGGTRKTAGARSDEDAHHPQGQEVIIVRYEKGLAYIRTIEPDEFGLPPEPSLTKSPESEPQPQ